jgi:dienelactone hydrolase
MPEPEQFKLDVAGHSVSGTICLPETAKAGRVPSVLLCRNLVDHDPSIDRLWDAFIDRALEAKLAVVSFEPRCAHLILDDFDAYTLDDFWRDAEAVLYHIGEHSGLTIDPLVVIGYRLGSLAALRLASAHATINRVCLVSPMLDGRHVLGMTNGEDSHAAPAHLPKRMLEELDDFDVLPIAKCCRASVLLLHGAADRVTPSEQSIEYDRALSEAGLSTRLEFIARADHTFNQPETRKACIDRMIRFSETKSN